MALLETADLREAIAVSRRDPRPAIPAEQMFAEMDAVIDQVQAARN
jgi:antitoxin StbD